MTLEDLAASLGISRSLASRAFTGNGSIAPKTREKVLQKAQELGYRPNPNAQRLAGGRCLDTIGLFSLGLDFGVTTEKIQTIQRLLAEQGFHVPLYAYGDYSPIETKRQAELMNALLRQQPRAIVCATRGLEPEALEGLTRFQDEGGIVVCYDYPSELACDQVVFDREDNNYQTARHLLELGHRDLGLYMEGEAKPHSAMKLSGARVQGFKRALGEFGMSVNPQWMFYGGLYEQGGKALAKQFLALNARPTGMCIINDRAASAFINEVQRAGVRVPDDVSVIGHDNQSVADCCAVPLTTATHPVQEIAQSVVEMLLSRFDGSYQGDARQKNVRGTLIERQSTQPPRAADRSATRSVARQREKQLAQTLA